MAELKAFLRAASGQRFDPVTDHCLMLAADWVRARTGRDPAAPWRGRIVSEQHGAALVARAGGMAAFIDTALARVGLPAVPVCEVAPGDLGLITLIGPNGPLAVCGIRTGARWAVRSTRGIWIGRATATRAWRID